MNTRLLKGNEFHFLVKLSKPFGTKVEYNPMYTIWDRVTTYDIDITTQAFISPLVRYHRGDIQWVASNVIPLN